MKFACPKCSHPCGIFRGACPGCGFSLTLWSVLKFYWQRVSDALTKATALRCPKCGFPNSARAKRCEHCQADLTVRLAVNVAVEPARRRWRQFMRHVTPQTKRRIQWAYLVFSGGLLWWLLAYVEKNGGKSWPLYMALSVIYVSVLAFFALWLIPRRVFVSVFRYASPAVKLALSLNALSLMLVVQLFIKEWWARALILAGLFAVAWLGAWLLYRLILPMAAMTEAVFLGTGNTEFDPTAPQGRTARFD